MGLYTSPISKRQFESSGYDGAISYYFGDINAKVVHRFNNKNKLELNFFTNRDYYSYTKVEEWEYLEYIEDGEYGNSVDWSNEVVSAAWVNNWKENGGSPTVFHSAAII